MPWITLTAENLNAYLVAEQLDALRTQALAADQTDPFAEIAPDVISKVRAYIASNRDNQLDVATDTIPSELKIDVTYLILAPMLGRLGIALTADQAKQVDLAQTTLIALRDRKLLVTKPDNAVTPKVQGGPSVEIAKSTTRRATRDSLNGL